MRNVTKETRRRLRGNRQRRAENHSLWVRPSRKSLLKDKQELESEELEAECSGQWKDKHKSSKAEKSLAYSRNQGQCTGFDISNQYDREQK